MKKPLKNSNKLHSMSKGKKRALLITAGAFLFSISCSVTATLAYYTINTAFSVEHLNINVGSIDANLYLGIRDKATGLPKFDDISEEEWKEGLDLSHNALEQVSAMYSESWLNDSTPADQKMPKFCSPYNFGVNKGQTPVASGDGYVQKEYFLRSTQDCSLYLSDKSFFVPNEEKNKVTAATYGLSVDELNEVVNSIRMSLYVDDPTNYVIINPGNSNVTYFGGPLDLNLDGFYDYDPETNEEYLYGQPKGVVPYDRIGQSTTPYENSTSTFIANHKAGVKGWDTSNPNYFKQENSRKLNEVTINEDEGDTTNTPICILRKNQVQRVVISIYLEGWDTHTIDSIQRASLDVSVLFTALYNI